MKVIKIIIHFCVALSPSIIYGKCDDGNISALQIKLEKEETIDGIFKPAKNGLLGVGAFGVMYKGTLLHSVKREVAMKFTASVNAENAMKEYEMYTYLNAINNADVERYGIPAVYYYGTWDDFILMAITLLDAAFNVSAKKGEINQLDILIIFQEFVRITKYIHSHGVHHNDIKFENMMFRKQKAFIIDYNIAAKFYRKRQSQALTDYYSPEMARENGIRYAKEDWSSFLQSMCHFVGVKFYRFNFGSMDNIILGDFLKKDIPNIMRKLAAIDQNGLRRVYVEFAEYVFADEIQDGGSHISRDKKRKRQIINDDEAKTSIYDHLFRIISEEIAKLDLPKPVLVSWLTDEQRKGAIAELESSPTPDISSIKDPVVMLDAEYPEINFNYFSEHRTINFTIA